MMRRLLILPLLLVAAAPAPDPVRQLQEANREARAADARSRALEREAAAERDSAAQARVEEAAVAARIEAAEAAIRAGDARLALVGARLAAGRARLEAQQAPTLGLVAALQAMGRRPTTVALIQPGSTRDLIHLRAVLGAIAPAVQARTQAVRADLTRVRVLRADAALATRAQRSARGRLESERLALVRLESEHRARGAELGLSALAESDRAIALGERARGLVDELAAGTLVAETRAALAALPGPLPRPAEIGGDARVRDFAVPPYRLPVPGRVAEGLGETSTSGVRARGLTLATPPGVSVVAPAGGTVLFARRFRGYGQVVIIDHGDSWTSALTGLGEVAVRPNQQVAAGAVLGSAPLGDSPRIAVELRRRGEPIDLAQLLR